MLICSKWQFQSVDGCGVGVITHTQVTTILKDL